MKLLYTGYTNEKKRLKNALDIKQYKKYVVLNLRRL